MLGRILGNYRLQAHIGSGGMGVVYRGEHTLIGRRAAVKVLLPEYSNRKDLIRRFFNEAKAAASAQHPGIVEVYDFGQAGDGTAYLIMELLEGDTLWQRLRKAKRLEERQALVIARQIAAALAAAHQAGVIHRDLKPGNIFLLDAEEPGGVRVKLMDFGVAKLMREDSFGEGLTTTGAIVGTPTFMSPEQCRGGGNADRLAQRSLFARLHPVRHAGRAAAVFGRRLGRGAGDAHLRAGAAGEGLPAGVG